MSQHVTFMTSCGCTQWHILVPIDGRKWMKIGDNMHQPTWAYFVCVVCDQTWTVSDAYGYTHPTIEAVEVFLPNCMTVYMQTMTSACATLIVIYNVVISFSLYSVNCIASVLMPSKCLFQVARNSMWPLVTS